MDLDQKTSWMGGLPTSLESMIIASVVREASNSSTEIQEFLKRSQFRNFDKNRPFNFNEAPSLGTDMSRSIQASPVQAKMKRRRSVASAPEDIPARRPSRRNRSMVPRSDDDLYLHRRQEVAGGPRERVQTSRRVYAKNHYFRKRRTSFLRPIKLRKRRRLDDGGTVSSNTTFQMDESTKEAQALALLRLPLYEQAEYNKNSEPVAYEQKGAFLLTKDKGNDVFRFPSTPSQLQPVWRAGDGFSGDEARPRFSFPTTSMAKQRRTELISRMGKLQLESETGYKDDMDGSRINCSNSQHPTLTQSETGRQRSIAKDVWPTKYNFAEELGPRHRRSIALKDQEVSSSTILAPSTQPPQKKDTIFHQPLPIRARKHSDFENFGRRLKGSNWLHFPDKVGHLSSRMQRIDKLKPSNGTHEDEKGYEADLEDAVTSSTYIPNNTGDDEEREATYEDTSRASRSRESSAKDSAIFVQDDIDNGRRLDRYLRPGNGRLGE
ncbi:hypothetical protein F4774DRAFT_430108 [Daldinia eschscholtzii]|nr:hypothetical protein F4774DRAFT_430108 [Daldinia eschscholtzii]